MSSIEEYGRGKYKKEEAKGRIRAQQKWLRFCMKYKRRALWATNFIPVQNEPVELKDSLTPAQKAAIAKEKERVELEKQREREALEASIKAKQAATKRLEAQQQEQDEAAAAAAAAQNAAELLALQEQLEHVEAGGDDVMSDSQAEPVDDGLTPEERLQKELKESGQMWLADHSEVEERKARYALMTDEEIMEEAVEWKEMVDPITEHVFWLHEATMEKMHHEPQSTRMLREKGEREEAEIKLKEAAREKLLSNKKSKKKRKF
jgi:hypothetical protein